MPRLTAETLRGIWAGATMSWDERDRFDEDTYRTNVERLCRGAVHGVYTTGSTGEFYALDFGEFRAMVDIVCETCRRHGKPLQIGCCSDNTRQTLRYLQYVAQKPEVGAAQIVIPYWMELSDRELLGFFRDLYAACPQVPLVHYNIPRAKRYLTGADYLRVLEAAPSLIGVKFTYAGSHFGDLQEALLLTPQLSYFVGENLLVSAMMLGARGSYSSLVCTNPTFMLTMYDCAAGGRWAEAIEMQKLVARFFRDAFEFIQARGEDMSDPVFDKGLGVASGFVAGSQRTRAPYIGWSDETVAALREWMRARYPMFLSPSS
mgnify:CR=1 FL=1